MQIVSVHQFLIQLNFSSLSHHFLSLNNYSINITMLFYRCSRLEANFTELKQKHQIEVEELKKNVNANLGIVKDDYECKIEKVFDLKFKI